jgi:hypothetical protein
VYLAPLLRFRSSSAIARFSLALSLFGVLLGSDLAYAKRTFKDLDPALVKEVTYEQTLNDRIENTDQFASIKDDIGIDPQYLPDKQPEFFLKSVWVPETMVDVLGEPLPANLIRVQKGRRFVKILIHPESISLYKNETSLFKWFTDTDQPDFFVPPTMLTFS